MGRVGPGVREQSKEDERGQVRRSHGPLRSAPHANPEEWTGMERGGRGEVGDRSAMADRGRE